MCRVCRVWLVLLPVRWAPARCPLLRTKLNLNRPNANAPTDAGDFRLRGIREGGGAPNNGRAGHIFRGIHIY